MISGSCMCKKVVYEVDADALFMYHCHCGICRSASGASFVTNIVVPYKALTLVSGAENLKRFESSPNKYRYFCSSCGSPIYSHGQNTKEYISIRSGTLHGDPKVRPSYHAYTAFKAQWVEIADGLRQYAEAKQ